MKTILVTGGCGFIGSHFIQRLLSLGTYFVVNVDIMNYCANAKNISTRYNFDTHQTESVDLTNYCFYEANIRDSHVILDILRKHQVDFVFHFAAQTHVDQSFGNSSQFVLDNVLGTSILLECCREFSDQIIFFHISTDEIYGSVTPEKEELILNYGMYDPTNPYAATKAAAELMVKSYYKSYKLPVIITRSNNVYGPHQFWEKITPKFIYTLAKGDKCPIYGQGQAMRKYLYVEDACDAYQLILEKGQIGEIYEMGSDHEYTALEISHKIISLVKPDQDPEQWLNYVEDRKFHDQRYLVNPKKLSELGWSAKTPFDVGLQRTVEWYLNYAIPESYWSHDHNISIGLENNVSKTLSITNDDTLPTD